MAALYGILASVGKRIRRAQDFLFRKAGSEAGQGFSPVFPGLSPDQDRQYTIRLYTPHKSIAHLAHACHLLDIVDPNNLNAPDPAAAYGGCGSSHPLVAGC